MRQCANRASFMIALDGSDTPICIDCIMRLLNSLDGEAEVRPVDEELSCEFDESVKH